MTATLTFAPKEWPHLGNAGLNAAPRATYDQIDHAVDTVNRVLHCHTDWSTASDHLASLLSDTDNSAVFDAVVRCASGKASTRAGDSWGR